MSIQKYTSDTKTIFHNDEVVFNYLSNFENLASYVNSGLLEKITQQVPQIKITEFHSDRDCCRFSISGIGSAEIRITNRDPFKTIKIESSGGLPVSIIFWIQLIHFDENVTKMRLTLHAEMGMIVKMMLGSKLEEGINYFADLLTTLPFEKDLAQSD